MATKSIVSNERQCWVCGTTYGLHKHHIYEGTANRKQSEKWGCWVYLCGRHHNLSNEGVHFNKDLDISLKEYTQRRFERCLGTREDFINIFGKSFILD